jgi:hypothetical protein
LTYLANLGTLLDTFGQFWTILDNFGQFWTILDNFGQFWTILDFFGHFWTLLDNFGQFWTIFGQFWTIFRTLWLKTDDLLESSYFVLARNNIIANFCFHATMYLCNLQAPADN